MNGSSTRPWRALATGLTLAIFIFFAPFLWARLVINIETPNTAQPTEAVLVFGAIVRNRSISPLHAQRLDTAADLWRDGKTDQIVVSNSLVAARVMRAYLLDQGVPAENIELDGQAERTPQTCGAELARGTPRSISFISQTFHLPRLAFQCRQLGLSGQLITASGPSNATLWTKARVRTARYIRETGLLWGAILNVYPE